MTWARILAGLVGLFNWLARRLDEAKVRADERDDIELARRREDARLDGLVDVAVKQLHDDAEAVAADHRNRARNPVLDNRKVSP